LLTTQVSLATSIGWWLQESGEVVLRLKHII